ncbi:YbaN family protein [Kangiella sp. TOML190]|uniref:YbaN family protein n=1 Tax=Kangiella sp. TOML190 TaxID=2931351 RepID=UPI002041488C|nr:YbaN family protein [Kangiella sp. TOML190]
MGKLFYTILGWLALALGALGLFLPLLPTTPFVISAAFLLGKSSPRTRQWLISNKTFGPIITDWELKGAIAPRIKMIACSMMVLVIVISIVLKVNGLLILLQVLCIVAAASYILTRPSQ